ncbi:hypothetical protein nvc1_080 [Namao virus]|nr:hypothetical protein nvc1_080 [Namao virus]
MIAPINFCHLWANEKQLITDSVIKSKIGFFIHHHVNLYKTRYEIIKYCDQLNAIKTNEDHFYALPHYAGMNYIMVNLRLSCDPPHSDFRTFIVSKKDLKFAYQTMLKNIERLKIYEITSFIPVLSRHYMKTSIFDGKLCQYKNKYVLYNIYMINNKYLPLCQHLYERLNNIRDIDMSYIFSIVEIFLLKDMISLFSKGLKPGVNGIIFYPKAQIGTSYIYVNSLEIEQLKKTLVLSDQIEKKNWYKVVPTSIVDVYEVFKDAKKLGILAVQSLKMSRCLEKIYQNTKSLKIYCVYSSKFEKFMPLMDLEGNIKYR